MTMQQTFAPADAGRASTQQDGGAQEDQAFRLDLRRWLETAYADFARAWPGGADPRTPRLSALRAGHVPYPLHPVP